MEQPTTFYCSVCGEEFSTPQQLELHRREKHQQTEASDVTQIQIRAHSQYDENGEVF